MGKKKSNSGEQPKKFCLGIFGIMFDMCFPILMGGQTGGTQDQAYMRGLHIQH